jgi:hypothetical protein
LKRSRWLRCYLLWDISVNKLSTGSIIGYYSVAVTLARACAAKLSTLVGWLVGWFDFYSDESLKWTNLKFWNSNPWIKIWAKIKIKALNKKSLLGSRNFFSIFFSLYSSLNLTSFLRYFIFYRVCPLLSLLFICCWPNFLNGFSQMLTI